MLNGCIGRGGNHIQHDTNRSLYANPLLYDRIRLDCGQILLVLLLHAHQLHLLYAVRYDACGLDTKLSNRRYLHVFLPQSMESLLRFPHSKTGKFTNQNSIY